MLRAQKNTPKVIVTNTMEVFLALDDVHDDVLKFPPMELFGFNVGEWIVSDNKELEGASKKYTVMIFK